MTHILDTILEQKRSEVALLRRESITFAPRSGKRRPFAASLRHTDRLAIIAEVKKASPSKGVICREFDPVAIGTGYERNGASAISVLTDERFFQGHTDYLLQVRAATALPVLRKDFIIDELQVRQTAHLGADAMLLIAAALDNALIKDLYDLARELDIEPLIEIHSASELERVMRLEPLLLGINNRNLVTFKTDISVSIELCRLIPSSVTVVAESGIGNAVQARALRDAGISALLVGESLMRAADCAALIGELACQALSAASRKGS